MSTKLLVSNATRVYTEKERNTRMVRNTHNTLATLSERNAGPLKTYDYVGFLTIFYLSFIQQLRVNTDITSHELGKKAVDYLEGSLRNTLSDMEEDFDVHTKSLLTTTTTRAHDEKSNIYNIVMTSVNEVAPEIFTNTYSIHLHLYLIQQIRINTDITSHKLGKESLNYLNDVLYNTLADMEYEQNNITQHLIK